MSSKYFVHFHTSLFRSKCSSFFLSSCSPISFLIPSASICKTEGSRFLGSADELQPYKYKQRFVKTREKRNEEFYSYFNISYWSLFLLPFCQRIFVLSLHFLSNILLQDQDVPIVILRIGSNILNKKHTGCLGIYEAGQLN